MGEPTSRNISIISILEEESPPDYDGTTSPPPFHSPIDIDTLPQSLLALQIGPPTDIVNVPMISSHYKPSLKNMFTGRKEVIINVHVRRMSREHYVRHYAHDGLGNYIGTAAPALDAALVIIPGRSTKEDFEEQIRRLRVGREEQLLRAVGTRNPPIGSYYG